MRWSPEALGNETEHKDPSFINQGMETVFHLPHCSSCSIFNYKIKQCKVAPITLLNLSFKHNHSIAVT